MTRFSKSLRLLEQTRRFSIDKTPTGWEVREERNDQVVRHAMYQDWHRVERVHRSFVTKLNDLARQGWAEI